MKRIPMSLHLQPQSFAHEWPCRTIRTSDANDLAILLYAAFRGTIDDEGEPFSTAVDEIAKTLAGDYGRLLSDCSFVIEKGEFLSSACLISWYEPAGNPFVVFTMTRPEAKGQGMARFLLKQSINALINRGDTNLTLIVTDGNLPAQHLYASLGFRAFSVT
jgi:GNAT superfamily N-acetyltransferase